MNKSKVKAMIFNLVFLVFAVRIATLILLEPYIGIANNGDFQRLMAPVGLDYSENIWADENRDKYFFNYITNDFIFIEPIDNGWHQLFSVFPRLAVFVSKMFMQESFDLRYMGVVNAIFYLGSVYFLFWFVKQIKGVYSYCLLGVFFLILGDATIIQYFNSFYSEIGSITSILLLWCLLAYSFLFVKEKTMAIKYTYVCIDSVVACFAILCKQQDILIVFPIVLLFLNLFRRLGLKNCYSAVWILVFGAVIIVHLTVNKAGGNITAFNVINKEILSASQKPHEHLREMGLAEADIKVVEGGIGQTAFEENGALIWDEYGSYFTRGNEIRILINEPQIILRSMIERASSLFKDDDDLGNYMKETGAAPKEKTSENKLWYNIRGHLYRSNFAFYIGIIIFSICLCIYALRSPILKNIPNDLFLVYGMLPCNNILRYLIVVFGDANEDVKHFLILNFEFDFMFVIDVILIIYIVSLYINRRSVRRS